MYEKLIEKINKTKTKKDFMENSYIISKSHLQGLLSYNEFIDLINYNNNIFESEVI